MRKMYLISALILASLTFVVFALMEGGSAIALACPYALVVLLAARLTAPISRYLLERGRRIEKLRYRVLYFIALPAVALFLAIAFFAVIMPLLERDGDSFGAALTKVIMMFGVVLAMLVPAVQTLLFLPLRYFCEHEE